MPAQRIGNDSGWVYNQLLEKGRVHVNGHGVVDEEGVSRRGAYALVLSMVGIDGRQRDMHQGNVVTIVLAHREINIGPA